MSQEIIDGHTRAEWETLIARVDETLRNNGQRVAITAHATPSAPAPTPRRRLPTPAPDYAAMTTEKLWQLHAAIEDGAKRTAFFRAHIKPRIK
jgi:nicotinamidase-related amidase